MRQRMIALLLCLVSLTPSFGAGAQSDSPTFWLGGVDSVVRKDRHLADPADYMQLFQADSPWAKAAARVAVFKISMQFASRSSDGDLAAMIADLRRRNIGLAIEMGMLRNDRGCGKGEGYMPADLPGIAMKRIARLGGEVRYIAMDEVVFFGHERNWPENSIRACQDSIPEVVHEAVATLADIRQTFPQVQVGDIEPVTNNQGFDAKHLVQDYLNFADRFRSESGTALAFLHADIAWRSKNWQPALAPLKAGLVVRGIRYGIIVGGDPDYTDDVSWTHAGLHQLSVLRADSGTSPQDIVIQSWQPLPRRYLPENTPGTTTWMLLEAEKP